MSDKLVKTSTEILPATSFADAIEHAYTDENELANVDLSVDCARCKHSRIHHCPLDKHPTHCLMSGCKCKSFVVVNSLAFPVLPRCPACGNTNMNDPQAQFVGACSPRCAKALGVPDEVLQASGSVPLAQLANVSWPLACRKCGGCGSISVPGRPEDVTWPRCFGTGIDDIPGIKGQYDE